MLQEMLITLDLFPTKVTQKSRMCEWKEEKFCTTVIQEFWNFWIKIKHFLAFQKQSFSLWFTGLKWNFLFWSESTLISVSTPAAKKPFGNCLPSSSCSPRWALFPSQTVFPVASLQNGGLGASRDVSHWLSHKEKQPLFFIFHGHNFIKVFFPAANFYFDETTVSHRKTRDFFLWAIKHPSENGSEERMDEDVYHWRQIFSREENQK